MDIYREIILDHYKNPRNFGHLTGAVDTAEAYNATCGDRIRMEMVISGNKIKDIRFSGEGCVVSQASASMLTEKVKGLTTKKVSQLKTEEILKLLGTTLTPSRVKCAVLPLEVLQKALAKRLSNHVK
jgi:nitrogen fixation NifU-like protein